MHSQACGGYPACYFFDILIPYKLLSLSVVWQPKDCMHGVFLRSLPLRKQMRCHHLQWYRERATWTSECYNVVFSDESRFCLSIDSHCVRVWRRFRDRSNPAATVEHHTERQRGFMIWGAIAYESKLILVRIFGNMMDQWYCGWPAPFGNTTLFSGGAQCHLPVG